MAPVAARSAGAVGIGTAIIISLAVAYFFCDRRNNSSKNNKKKTSKNGIINAIGNTPLIRINSLSDATGCEVIIILFFNFQFFVLFQLHALIFITLLFTTI
jgi:cysteine synthase A